MASQREWNEHSLLPPADLASEINKYIKGIEN